ncbi:tetratricopeptide repeat protein [Phenylobacterium sp.]|jgi:predicted O-linked N-acetylglucosamine transferase (SPINDLY family)|uniref:O-linked N-acetylglucosamine transferase family protein n=1 Tax=Phenylobacterium sp. TaxID=1871053 RepID=UPI002F95BCF1
MTEGISDALAEALALRDAGRAAEAEPRLAGRTDPDALALLAHLAMLQGRTGDAEEIAARIEVLAPGSAAALRTRARLLQRARKVADAVDAAWAAHRVAPNDAETALVLAATLLAAGDADSAARVVADLAGAPAKLVLAQAAARLGRNEEAMAACEAALAQRPDYPLWSLLGSLRLAARQTLRAAEAFRNALERNADDVTALLGLAEAMDAEGDDERARMLFDRALALQPTWGTFLHGRLTLPLIPASNAEIDAARARYAGAIEAAAAQPGQLGEAERAFSASWFHLAYHGRDDRPIMEALAGLFAAKAPDLRTVAPHLAAWSPPAGRIRVGICSAFLRNHTIGLLYKGLIRELDRSRFEVLVAHLPGDNGGGARAVIGALADRSIDLPADTAGQRHALAQARLDVLFYPDIGMSIASWLLAHARLAPVQAVGWGHPDTTGLHTLDYFVSADAIEAEGAEAHYTERLVRLPRLPCFYDGLPRVTRQGRRALGLPDTGALYGCLQSLFKLHPDFDAMLAAIAAGDPAGRIVFVEGRYPRWREMLQARWAAHPGLNERVLFLPRAPLAKFLAIVAEMDVLLDPPHFGSGNTLYEAMGLGRPIVTWPSAFARGRIVAAAYHQMGIANPPIAGRPEDYAGLALALAADPDRRARMAQDLSAGAARDLYRDQAAVRAFERFLEAAVAAAGRGETLPKGWKPATDAP